MLGDNQDLDARFRREAGIGIDGVIFMCRQWVDRLLFHPTNAYDHELLLKAIRERNIPHQLDYNVENQMYTFHIWLDESVNVDIVEPLEYSYENECPLLATAVAAALLMKFASEDE